MLRVTAIYPRSHAPRGNAGVALCADHAEHGNEDKLQGLLISTPSAFQVSSFLKVTHDGENQAGIQVLHSSYRDWR